MGVFVAFEEAKMQKKISIFWTVIICLIAIVLTFEITFVIMSVNAKKAQYELAKSYKESIEQLTSSYESINEMYNALPDEMKSHDLFKKLSYIDTYYRALYVGEIDEERLSYYLMSGYIQGIGDRYGEYYTANDIDSVFQEADGKLYGIGINVTYNEEHGAIEIISTVKDSPADKVGMQASDIIVAVGSLRVSEQTYYQAIDMIKGEKGTSVKLTVLRDGAELTFEPVRDEIKIVTVTGRKYSLDSKIGIVRITEFNNTTSQQLKETVTSLVNDGCTSIVFDVRHNPGGTLDGVIGSLDFLLPEGDLCYVRNAFGETIKTLKSDAECLDPNIKISVLINENTASAAELFAASLRDYKRATLVGKNTFGKGTMQSTYLLPNGEGLKLSTNTYNPPCDVNYDGTGVAPDVEIELNEDAKNKNFFKLTDAEDNQLLEACRKVGFDKATN